MGGWSYFRRSSGCSYLLHVGFHCLEPQASPGIGKLRLANGDVGTTKNAPPPHEPLAPRGSCCVWLLLFLKVGFRHARGYFMRLGIHSKPRCKHQIVARPLGRCGIAVLAEARGTREGLATPRSEHLWAYVLGSFLPGSSAGGIAGIFQPKLLRVLLEASRTGSWADRTGPPLIFGGSHSDHCCALDSVAAVPTSTSGCTGTQPLRQGTR